MTPLPALAAAVTALHTHPHLAIALPLGTVLTEGATWNA